MRNVRPDGRRLPPVVCAAAILLVAALAVPAGATARSDGAVDVVLRDARGSAGDPGNPNAVSLDAVLTRPDGTIPPSGAYEVDVAAALPTGGDSYPPEPCRESSGAFRCLTIVDRPGAWTFTATARLTGAADGAGTPAVLTLDLSNAGTVAALPLRLRAEPSRGPVEVITRQPVGWAALLLVAVGTVLVRRRNPVRPTSDTS